VTQFKIECGRRGGPFVLNARNGEGGLAITLTSQPAPASGEPSESARTPVEAMLAAGARVASILVTRDGGSVRVEGSAEIGRRCEVLLPTWAVTPGRTAG
jgi:acetylornithine deacetylase/succinyl-diaminopimelate desuccinylase-like protein